MDCGTISTGRTSGSVTVIQSPSRMRSRTRTSYDLRPMCPDSIRLCSRARDNRPIRLETTTSNRFPASVWSAWNVSMGRGSCRIRDELLTLWPAGPLPTNHEVTSSDHWLASTIHPPTQHLRQREECAGCLLEFEYRFR